MRIMFWVPYPTEGASNRYRIEQYLSYVAAEKIEYTLRPFWGKSAYRILFRKGLYVNKTFYLIMGTIRRFCDIALIARYDIVFIHRQAYPIGGLFFERLLLLLNKPIIFDFDDAIYLPATSQTNSFIEKFKNSGKVAAIIRMSKYIIAGNSYLAQYAFQYNKNVTVIPTSVDTDKYSNVNGYENNGRIIIGWIGSITTVDFLNLLKPAFRELAKLFPSVIFKIVGGSYYDSTIPNIICIPWSIENEIEHLKTFNIGIMPMPDNEWTRGKCGFKLIIYMSMGIPCVCSPVGLNNEIISDGENGLFARSGKEWVEKLSLLVMNSHIRGQIGLSGRKTVEERYSVRVNVPKLLKVIKNVYSEIK